MGVQGTRYVGMLYMRVCKKLGALATLWDICTTPAARFSGWPAVMACNHAYSHIFFLNSKGVQDYPSALQGCHAVSGSTTILI